MKNDESLFNKFVVFSVKCINHNDYCLHIFMCTQHENRLL